MGKKESKIIRDGQAIVVQKNVMSVDEQGNDQLTTMSLTTTIIPAENQKEVAVSKPKNRVDLPIGKYIYLITVKGLSYWEYFITSRVDKGAASIEFIGIKINGLELYNLGHKDPLRDLEKMSSYDEIIDYVNQCCDVKLVSMCYPYSEIHCIQNLTYNKKK